MSNETVAQLFDLHGKGAIVTGGASGLGQGIAFRLAEAGASVMIADINMTSANQTSKEILSRGGKAQAIHADVSSASDAEKVVQATLSAFGSLDILVNNAAIFPMQPFLEINEKSWNRVLDINLKGVFLFSQLSARAMIKAGHGGKIINIASFASLKPMGGVLYCVSKAGVAMLTKCMALELSPNKILVNAIAPGGIETPGGLEFRTTEAPKMGITPEQYKQAFISILPLGYLAEPDDIAKTVLFLASKASDYMTGEMIVVDAGLQLK